MTDVTNIIPIGSDHAGYKLKTFLTDELSSLGYRFDDFGTFSEDSVDYPDFIHPVARSVDTGQYKKGIIICGSGNGAIMIANKYLHVRAALCWNRDIAYLSRTHNDANIIALPGRFITPEEALEAVKVFLKSDFEGGRHTRRVEKISQLLK
jgi:ribose 5-phosphate isomerase B